MNNFIHRIYGSIKTLFLVHINGLAAILDCYGIKIKLFADDAKLYVQIVNELNVV